MHVCILILFVLLFMIGLLWRKIASIISIDVCCFMYVCWIMLSLLLCIVQRSKLWLFMFVFLGFFCFFICNGLVDSSYLFPVAVYKCQCGSFKKISAGVFLAFLFFLEMLMHGALFYFNFFIMFFLICSCRGRP